MISENIKRSQETVKPEISAIYDDLNDKECTPERYATFEKMWDYLSSILPSAVKERPYAFITNYDQLDASEKLNAINEQSKMRFKHYHDLYLYLDCYLLADVWEQFRQLSLSAYGLEAQNFVSMPALSWTAMLKKYKCMPGSDTG